MNTGAAICLGLVTLLFVGQLVVVFRLWRASHRHIHRS